MKKNRMREGELKITVSYYCGCEGSEEQTEFVYTPKEIIGRLAIYTDNSQLTPSNNPLYNIRVSCRKCKMLRHWSYFKHTRE